MAYPVFQSQGPQVNVSLFGDAAKTGVAVGQATPTFITSAIQGAEKGYQQGQDIRLKNAQIENAETISQINKLYLS